MKAIVIDDYGGVDQLRLREMPEPRPQSDEVLVRVRAAGVNPVDWKIRQGQLRLILHPKFPYVPAGDIAGEVVAAGAEAGQFKSGDPVVAFVDLRRGGGYAEFAVVKKTTVALKPPSLSFTEAASLPIAAGTTLQVLDDLGKVSAGANGSFSEERAASVTSPFRSPRRSERKPALPVDRRTLHLSSLGADQVINYSEIRSLRCDLRRCRQEFLRYLPTAPHTGRNLCDDTAGAERLFLEWRSIDRRNFQHGETREGRSGAA